MPWGLSQLKLGVRRSVEWGTCRGHRGEVGWGRRARRESPPQDRQQPPRNQRRCVRLGQKRRGRKPSEISTSVDRPDGHPRGQRRGASLRAGGEEDGKRFTVSLDRRVRSSLLRRLIAHYPCLSGSRPTFPTAPAVTACRRRQRHVSWATQRLVRWHLGLLG